MNNWTNFLPQIAAGWIILIAVVLIIVPFVVTVTCCVKMASRLGRSGFGWFLLSVFSLNPLICLACLYGLGETDTHRRDRIVQEEEWRNKVNVAKFLDKE